MKLEQQVSFIKIDKGVKNTKCEEFLYAKEGKGLDQLAMLFNVYGHEGRSEKMTWKEEFSHKLCRDIVLDVITHCVRKSITTEECEEKYECSIKDDGER